jgi:hypothetical protein
VRNDFGPPAEAARTVAQTNVVESNFLPAHSSFAQEPTRLPVPAGVIQARWSLLQQHSPSLLTTPSQHPLDSPRLTVSVFHGFQWRIKKLN